DVGEGPGADGLAARQVPAAGEVLGNLRGVAAIDHREHPLSRLEPPLLDPTQALARVAREVALRLLAVVHDVDARGDLLADDPADGAPDPRREGGRIV